MFSSWHPSRQGRDWPWLSSSFSWNFLSSLFLTTFSINSLQFLLSLSSCSPFSSHSFQTSLNAVLPSHSLSSSSPFPLHFLGICSIFQFFILNSSISTYSSPFFQNFPSLQPPLSIRSFFSYPLSFTATILLIQLCSQTNVYKYLKVRLG